MAAMLPKDEQIRALLGGDPYEAATQALRVSDMRTHSYSDVITVTRAEIDRYVEEHRIPMRKVCTDHSQRECVHFVRSKAGYEVYWFERGCIFDFHTFLDADEARRSVVDHLLNISGTGIKFA